MEQKTEFGPWLRQRRKALDLTQWDLAERVGCSGSTIQKIEDGVRRPSRQVAELLVEVLGVEPAQRDAFIHWARVGCGGDLDRPLEVRSQGPTTTSAPPGSNGHSAGYSAPAGQQPESPASPAYPPTNLPAPLTPLVGRESEMEKLHAYLARPEVRLLTLAGPPGIGKTRLGLRLAAQITPMFEDGVYFVGLAAVTDPDMVLPAIAQTLGVQQSQAQVESAVAGRVGNNRMLLVLDNFEQVLDAAPQVLELLSACPLLKLIITSREALRAPGEWRFPVPPLQLPLHLNGHRAEYHGGTPDELDALGRVASIALFTQRAKAVRPDFALTDENAEDIAAICMRLDGLPLAIELAAARMGLLTPADMRSRLDSRLKILKGGATHLPARQRTLRATIDWSYQLLNPEEKRLFSHLAVFSGGCSLEAIESVCGEHSQYGEHSDADENEQGDADMDVLDGVASLVNKSLLMRAEAGAQGVRLEMLETIREYALELLEESGEAEEIRRRHALYYRDLALQAEPGLLSAQQAVWTQRLAEKHDNLRSALDWCLRQNDSELSIVALSIAGSLWRFWWTHGHLSEGRRWLERALETADRTGAGGAGDTHVQTLKAKALKGLGNMAFSQTDYPAARSLYEAALAISRELGDEREVGALLNNIGNVNEELGRPEEARRALEESLTIARRTGYNALVAAVLSNLGGVAIDQGDYEHARDYATEALALQREAGHKWGVENTLTKVGIASLHLGEYSRARLELTEALQLTRELDDDLNMADILGALGTLACNEGDYDEARSLHLRSLAVNIELGHRSGVVECLRSLAEVAIETGHTGYAARLYGGAEALREEVGAWMHHSARERYEHFTCAGRARIGEAAWEQATREGRNLTLGQAVALGRREEAGPGS